LSLCGSCLLHPSAQPALTICVRAAVANEIAIVGALQPAARSLTITVSPPVGWKGKAP
jgi:predicted MFS family arabinose efflux permease